MHFVHDCRRPALYPLAIVVWSSSNEKGHRMLKLEPKNGPGVKVPGSVFFALLVGVVISMHHALCA